MRIDSAVIQPIMMTPAAALRLRAMRACASSPIDAVRALPPMMVPRKRPGTRYESNGVFRSRNIGTGR
jgi:hypothetical protein